MLRRAPLVLGLALLAAFDLALAASPFSSVAARAWWLFAAAGSAAGVVVAFARPDRTFVAVAIALGAHAAMRLYFVAVGFDVTYPGLLHLALAVALVAATVLAVRGREPRVALVVAAAVVVLLAVRSFGNGQTSAATRQLLNLGGFLVLAFGGDG